MKGIILAGGAGTRLYPITMVTSKQLLPVYNKPMIFYPLSTLMLANIREVLVISTPEDTPRLEELLGDGSQYGMELSYAVQEKPEGIAQAFLIGKDFIGDDPCALVLGDNIFYGNGLGYKLQDAAADAAAGKATVFGYYVEDPRRFGVVEFQKDPADRTKNLVLSVEEKPAEPKSHYAIVGLYFYPSGVWKLAEQVRPSGRGELEITSLNDMYLQQGILNVSLLGRGYTWMDAGTMDSLMKASSFVQMMEQHQGMMISAPEEIAYRYKWITREELAASADRFGKSPYGQRLRDVAEGRVI